ncbi:MAG: outer membrane protein transport protein [Planctomycetaceae bacterium]|nr:outer membrane protein transport protein [Planctomycetaceae bacterium]
MKLSSRLFVVAVVLTISYVAQQAALAQGVLLRSIGATNAAVGGTATAMPLDASGAIMWNPASISALQKNEMTFGMELIVANSRVESEVGTFSGSTRGEMGVVPAPNMAFVWRTCPHSPITYGLGMSAIGGAASLYPHKPLFEPGTSSLEPGGNPVLNDHGRSANIIILQVTPTVSAQLTDRLSVGVAPIVDLASLNINPMSLGRAIAPTDQSLMTYGTRYIWGAGFQVGTLYDFKNNWKAGFMFKSPIWAERLYFTGTDGVGDPGTVNFQLNLPMTLSAGISYDGVRDTVIGMDVRYLDYSNTAGLNKGVNPQTGVVEGLDWESVFSINLGMERKINNRMKARLGYCWNENPIPNRSAALCISAPMITQHVFSCGFSYAFARDLEMSAAYSHAFMAKQTGPLPGGGTVTNVLYADSFFAGITKRW